MSISSTLILENKTSAMVGKKREYLFKILSDKSPRFIEENFDYTAKLFDRKEKERLQFLKKRHTKHVKLKQMPQYNQLQRRKK